MSGTTTVVSQLEPCPSAVLNLCVIDWPTHRRCVKSAPLMTSHSHHTMWADRRILHSKVRQQDITVWISVVHFYFDHKTVITCVYFAIEGPLLRSASSSFAKLKRDVVHCKMPVFPWCAHNAQRFFTMILFGIFLACIAVVDSKRKFIIYFKAVTGVRLRNQIQVGFRRGTSGTSLKSTVGNWSLPICEI